jgi:hypothetical protein
MKCASVASKELIAQKCAICALAERTPGKEVALDEEGKEGTEEKKLLTQRPQRPESAQR